MTRRLGKTTKLRGGKEKRIGGSGRQPNSEHFLIWSGRPGGAFIIKKKYGLILIIRILNILGG